ncbi:fasciclin-like arabinogalactan protein 14 [Elaeis guineensis]|uniref:Fasciclin-like arabinogalactan protein 14 n=1 Tax=Elaeis guineensis var. tenera TaxID=51953 RepID=A0A6I9QGM8_ELAGV|nr:fasciclin-like arabinogalactan protein 14 [Elaeis guineensis]
MASNTQTLLLLPFLLFSVEAFNITHILESYSSYSTFNNYLTQTKLAEEINHRQTITILVVDNSKMSAVFSKPIEILKNIMAIHIILDYYDTNKLSHIPHKSALLTTLFQTSGIANNKLGFLNVTNMPNDDVVFGSATPEAPLSSTFTKMVVTKPYNISILEISDLILPPGIESAKQASPPATQEKAKPTNSTAHAPATIEESPADTPADAPNIVDSPMDSPQADAPDALDAPTTHSSASQTLVNGILGLVVGVIYLGAF